jgi:hypothetical protein
MHLPDLLTVTLQPSGPIEGGLGEILVALDINTEGRYYYGSVVGVTDSAGRVSIRGAQLDAEFVGECRNFPMDYKVPLAECDDVVLIHVQGGLDFLMARQRVAESSWVTDRARQAWMQARNGVVLPSQVSVDMRVTSATAVVLPIQPA